MHTLCVCYLGVADLGPESSHLCPDIRDAWEDVREKATKKWYVVCHQLGHHGLTHTLNQNLSAQDMGIKTYQS